MNEKLLRSVFNVLKKQYPFIIGVKYFKNGQLSIRRSRYDHAFLFEMDLKILQEIFPQGELDYNYMEERPDGIIYIPTTLFIEYEDDDKMMVYGDEVIETFSAILESVVPRYDTVDFAFKVMD